jgi:hypothetical protein
MRRTFRGIGPFLPTTMSDQEYADWYEEHAWDPSRYNDLRLERDLAPAAWLEPLLSPRSFDVSMTAPRGYEAYARLFFPFLRSGLGASGEWSERRVRWTEMAEQSGKVVHALMEQETISTAPDGQGTADRCTDQLSPEQFQALLPILTRHTASTEGWFLLWDGFGDLNERVFNPGIPKVHHAMRDFYLLKGHLSSYAEFSDDPSYLWPDDRAWCLCTDTDFSWSYLAGSRRCIAEILATPILDAVETLLDNPARSGMDTINDPDGEIPRQS